MGTVGEKMKALGAVGGGGAPVPVVCSSVRNHRFRVSFSSSPSSGPKTVRIFHFCFSYSCYKNVLKNYFPKCESGGTSGNWSSEI